MRDAIALFLTGWYLAGIALAAGGMKIVAILLPPYALYLVVVWLIGMVKT